jgi:hypothetical protein
MLFKNNLIRVFLVASLCIYSIMFLNTNECLSSEFKWEDGFLEKDYKFNIKKIDDTIFQIAGQGVAISDEKIKEKKGGVIRTTGYGDKNGNIKIGVSNWGGVPSIRINIGKDTSTIVKSKLIIIDDDNTRVGIKVDDGNKEASTIIHRKLTETLRK